MYYINCNLQFPMLVIGTKLDMTGENRLHEKPVLDVAQEWGADKIYLVCSLFIYLFIIFRKGLF